MKHVYRNYNSKNFELHLYIQGVRKNIQGVAESYVEAGMG